MLVPVIGLVQVGDAAMADRYAYLPLIGLFVAAAWALPPLRGGWRTAAGGAAAATALAVLSALTIRQVPHWKNNRSLYQHALNVAPGSWMMHANLAAELMAAGELREALEHLRATVRLRPELPEAHHNLGLALAALGLHQEAVAPFEQTLRLMPHHLRADYNLGLSLAALGRTAEAVPHLERGAARNPGSADALVWLGGALLDLGRLEEGAARFTQALRIEPRRAGALNFTLGNAYARAGSHQLAIGAYEQAIRSGMTGAGLHNNLGSALASVGRFREAEAAYAEALRLEPGQPDARRNLVLLRQRAAGGR
jgi:tetratricopeptide (TPR) repeat protein